MNAYTYGSGNRTKSALDAGRIAYGTLSLLPEPALPEIAGAVGFDFFVIDTEHVATDGQLLAHGVRAAQAAGVTPIVRVRHVEEKTFLWTLDTGVGGIMVPMVNDAATARYAYALSRYPPVGQRTICSATRAAGHGAYRSDLSVFLDEANDQMLLVGLLETPEAVANAKEIAAEGLDVLIVGRGDLSLKMGGYAPQSEPVTEATKRALSAVLDAGRVAGVLAYDVDDARQWIEFGCQFIIYAQPEMILTRHFRQALTEMRSIEDSASHPARAHGQSE